MSSVSFCVALALSVLGLSDARGFHSQALQLPGRSLQQNELATVTRLRVVNFATLAAANDEVVTENELSGKINVTASDEPVMYGAYYLGPSQVEQMDRIISTELEAVPASEATPAPVIGFPGRQLKGRSVLDSLNDMQPRRIPTIFAPFYSGFKFELVGRESPPGTTLHFSNMTLMVANATYESLATSGIMDYFDLQTSARVCMTNSMFVLESCKGFVPNSFHMWCCTKRQCNIQYTEQAIEDLGYPMPDALELLTCHELLSSGGQEEAKSAGGSGGSDLVVPLVASCLAVAAVLAVALIVVWRHRRTQRANRMKADEMQMQIGKYMQQLEKHREKSRNEQAELQKVKMQYKMLEMDLLANTASGKTASAKGLPSEDKAATETTQEDRTAPPQTLTVLDAGDSEVSAKAVQKQLRAVLNAADERTPVSVQAEIGRGAFGVVYRGVWKNIQVAIKTVLFQASGDIKNDPVLREAMLALRIAHPNLVATYRANVRTLEDTAAPGGGGQQQFQITGDITPSYQLFLLQEFCDSGTLYDWLSRERMHPGNTPDQAVIVRCALDIARGIQHLHHSDIVHGDLKPQNIMLTTIPEVVRAQSDTPSPPTFPYIAKLTDFGLSFQMDRNKSHMSNMRIGTPFYFAPEVQGKGYLSKAADTYSLGVLLWEMFHGMPPYAAENGHLVNNTSFPRFDLRHREDAPFSYVVVALACLSEDFEKRPSIDDVVVVLEDLNECLNGTPDGTQLMRNASLNRVTKGSYKAGFAAPASLVKQANAANATPAPRAGPQQRKRSPADGNVASVILKMLKHSGLHRDADLRKRLDVTDASELEKLAGVVSARTSGRAPQRCLRDVRGQNGAANVHGGQRWMFDVLPPSSVDGGQTPAPAMPQQQQQVPQQPPHQQPTQQPPRQ